MRMLVLDLSTQLFSEIQRLTVSSITTLVALEMVTRVVLVCAPDQRIECFISQKIIAYFSLTRVLPNSNLGTSTAAVRLLRIQLKSARKRPLP